jgi:hypothetical protein
MVMVVMQLAGKGSKLPVERWIQGQRGWIQGQRG